MMYFIMNIHLKLLECLIVLNTMYIYFITYYMTYYIVPNNGSDRGMQTVGATKSC